MVGSDGSEEDEEHDEEVGEDECVLCDGGWRLYADQCLDSSSKPLQTMQLMNRWGIASAMVNVEAH